MKNPRPALAPLLVAAALLALLGAPVQAEEPSDGDRVVLQGLVMDAGGRPAAGVTVLFEASRESFSLRHFENRRGESLQQPQVTGEDGRFRFEWTWDRHYNIFSLAFGLEVSRNGTPGFEILERREITTEMATGAPPALRVELENIEWLRWLQTFVDGRASADTKKIYRDLGRPQKLTVDGTVSSWWYFELGKVYRLDGGTLEQVVPFEPIRSPSPKP